MNSKYLRLFAAIFFKKTKIYIVQNLPALENFEFTPLCDVSELLHVVGKSKYSFKTFKPGANITLKGVISILFRSLLS